MVPYRIARQLERRGDLLDQGTAAQTLPQQGKFPHGALRQPAHHQHPAPVASGLHAPDDLHLPADTHRQNQDGNHHRVLHGQHPADIAVGKMHRAAVMSGIQEAGQGHVPDSWHEGHRYSHRREYQGCESGRQKLHPARNHSVSEHHSGQSQADDYCTHRQHQGLQRLILQYLRGRSPVQAQELVEPPVTGKNEAAVEP